MFIRTFVGSVVALALFTALGATNAVADIVAFTVPAGEPYPTPPYQPNRPVNLGLEFTANTNFSVDALGFYNQSDLTGSEVVGLYDQSGSLLTSATVLLTDSKTDGYFFHSIAPVALTAGATYTVVAETGNNPWSFGPFPIAPVPTAADITFVKDDYNYTGSLAFPNASGGSGPAYYGPNFEIAASTPEPGLYGVLAIGLSGLVLVSGRRRGSAADRN